MKSRRTHNPKRQLPSAPDVIAEIETLAALSDRATYRGNPEHKRNPGDFGLKPPSCPRPDKTLCDAAGILSRDVAIALLRRGIKLGLVSRQRRGEWPQNVWMVDGDGHVLEAQLENQETGCYHGYPVPGGDPFREIVLARWKEVCGHG